MPLGTCVSTLLKLMYLSKQNKKFLFEIKVDINGAKQVHLINSIKFLSIPKVIYFVLIFVVGKILNYMIKTHRVNISHTRPNKYGNTFCFTTTHDSKTKRQNQQKNRFSSVKGKRWKIGKYQHNIKKTDQLYVCIYYYLPLQ